MPSRRVRHREPLRHQLAAGDIHHDAAAGLLRPPGAGRVGLAQCRHVPRTAVNHAQAVEVTAVGRLQRGHERRPPTRREACRAVERAQAREPRVDHPQFLAGAPGHLVDLDVAGDVAGAGQKAGVMAAGRLELGRDGRDVHVLPDLDRRADRQPIVEQCQSHRCLKGAEVGIEVFPLVADHHQLARLVGGDQERGAQASKQCRKIGSVHGPQRSGAPASGPSRAKPGRWWRVQARHSWKGIPEETNLPGCVSRRAAPVPGPRSSFILQVASLAARHRCPALTSRDAVDRQRRVGEYLCPWTLRIGPKRLAPASVSLIGILLDGSSRPGPRFDRSRHHGLGRFEIGRGHGSRNHRSLAIFDQVVQSSDSASPDSRCQEMRTPRNIFEVVRSSLDEVDP